MINFLHKLIVEISNTNKGYINGQIDREKMKISLVKFLDAYLKKKINISQGEYRNFGLFTLILIERIKSLIILEDKILEELKKNEIYFYKCIDKINNDEFLYKKIKNQNNINKSDTENTKLLSELIMSKRSNYPKKVTKFFKEWLKKNKHNPYPSESEKIYFTEKTGLDLNQINNWFVNARRRILPYNSKKLKNLNF